MSPTEKNVPCAPFQHVATQKPFRLPPYASRPQDRRTSNLQIQPQVHALNIGHPGRRVLTTANTAAKNLCASPLLHLFHLPLCLDRDFMNQKYLKTFAEPPQWQTILSTFSILLPSRQTRPSDTGSDEWKFAPLSLWFQVSPSSVPVNRWQQWRGEPAHDGARAPCNPIPGRPVSYASSHIVHWRRQRRCTRCACASTWVLAPARSVDVRTGSVCVGWAGAQLCAGAVCSRPRGGCVTGLRDSSEPARLKGKVKRFSGLS